MPGIGPTLVESREVVYEPVRPEGSTGRDGHRVNLKKQFLHKRLEESTVTVPTTIDASAFVNNYLAGRKPPAFDILAWCEWSASSRPRGLARRSWPWRTRPLRDQAGSADRDRATVGSTPISGATGRSETTPADRT